MFEPLLGQADLKSWASEGLSTWLLTEIAENRLESKQEPKGGEVEGFRV